MKQPHDIPLCEPLDPFDWDESEVRDLIRTTPLRLDEAEQLCGPEGAIPIGRFL